MFLTSLKYKTSNLKPELLILTKQMNKTNKQLQETSFYFVQKK